MLSAIPSGRGQGPGAGGAAQRLFAPYKQVCTPIPVDPGVLETRHFTIQAKHESFDLKSVHQKHTQAKESGPLAWVNGEPATCFGPSRHTGTKTLML